MAAKSKTQQRRTSADLLRAEFDISCDVEAKGAPVERVGVIPESFSSAQEYADHLGLVEIDTDVSRYRKQKSEDLDLGA